MAESSSDRINEAVRACLGECYGSTAPINQLADFLARLRSEAAFLDEEIRAIEIAALHVISGLIQDESDEDPGRDAASLDDA